MTAKTNKVADLMITVGVAALNADALGYAREAFTMAESGDDEISAFIVKYPNGAAYIDALAEAYGNATGEDYKSKDALFNKPRRAYRLSIALIAAARSNLNLVEIGTFRSAESVLESVSAATGFCAALDRAQGFAAAFQPAQFVNNIMERLEAKGRSALKGLDGSSEEVAKALTCDGVMTLALAMRREVLAKGSKTRDAVPDGQIADTLEAAKAIKAANKKAAAELEAKRLADELEAKRVADELEAARIVDGVAEQSMANASLILQGDVSTPVESAVSSAVESSAVSSAVSSSLSAVSSSLSSSLSAVSSSLSPFASVSSALSVVESSQRTRVTESESPSDTLFNAIADLVVVALRAGLSVQQCHIVAGQAVDEAVEESARQRQYVATLSAPAAAAGKSKRKGDRETA